MLVLTCASAPPSVVFTRFGCACPKAAIAIESTRNSRKRCVTAGPRLLTEPMLALYRFTAQPGNSFGESERFQKRQNTICLTPRFHSKNCQGGKLLTCSI